MITFNPPISIQQPSITNQDGSVINFDPIILSQLDYTINYNNYRKSARAILSGLPTGITLWKGAEYDAAGQFTDVDVENRINALLGSDPKSVLEGLYLK